jgi:hypothetical protein
MSDAFFSEPGTDDLKNISPQNWRKNWRFFTSDKAKLLQKYDHSIGF